MRDLGDSFAVIAKLDPETDIKRARWPIIAAVSLTACSGGSDMVHLYQHVTASLSLDDKRILQRRIKESILKTTMLYGTPRALSALLPLYDAIPDNEIDNYSPRYDREQSKNNDVDLEKRGWDFFKTLWSERSAESIRELYMKHHKDMFTVWVKGVLDVVITEDAILDLIETETCMTAALICSRNPTQAVWHSKGIVRQGGTVNDVRLVYRIALKFADFYGCKVGDLPSVESIDFGEVTVH